jgi:hypothetical protein
VAGYYWHHGIYVSHDRVVQFGGGILDQRHACVEEADLSDFLQDDRVEVVPKQQNWVGLRGIGRRDLPPALPPDEIVRRARWLAAERFDGTYNLVGRNCETIALWCARNFAESLQRQRFQSVNASVGIVVWLAYAYLNGRGRLPAWGQWAVLAFIAVRAPLLVMYYLHNRRFYRDISPYYAEHGRS